MITITGIRDHLRPEWLITITGMRTYGASKAAGDSAVTAENPAHLVLRVSWVFGVYGTNFVKTMLGLGRERRELRIVADQIGGPTEARRRRCHLDDEGCVLSAGLFGLEDLSFCRCAEYQLARIRGRDFRACASASAAPYSYREPGLSHAGSAAPQFVSRLQPDSADF